MQCCVKLIILIEISINENILELNSIKIDFVLSLVQSKYSELKKADFQNNYS